jgi:hypothetical protein
VSEFLHTADKICKENNIPKEMTSHSKGDTEIILIIDSANWFVFNKGVLLDFNKKHWFSKYLINNNF